MADETERRWEIAATIGPCGEAEAEALAEQLAQLVEPLGGAVGVARWDEENDRPVDPRYDALAAELDAAEKENKRLCDIVEKTADGHLLEQLAAHELRERVMALEKRNGELEAALRLIDADALWNTKPGLRRIARAALAASGAGEEETPLTDEDLRRAAADMPEKLP